MSMRKCPACGRIAYSFPADVCDDCFEDWDDDEYRDHDGYNDY